MFSHIYLSNLVNVYFISVDLSFCEKWEREFIMPFANLETVACEALS
jgi:hypothetical protein